MIRPMENNDLNTVLNLWLETNISAHHFISADYWKSNYEIVRALLPQAEIYVYEDDVTRQIDGFVGLNENYIEGIFVRESVQSKGIGRQLLDYSKKIRDTLSLNVYEKNTRAIHFYQREAFIIREETIDDNTGEKDLLMSWSRSQHPQT